MVYDYGETGNWLVEELVHGTRITTEDFSRFLADGGARDFYGASVRIATVGGSPQTIDLARKLTELDPSLPAISHESELPVGLIHGDLAHHNVMRDRTGRFWLIDMSARVAPIAMDMVKMVGRNPELLDVALDFLRGMNGGPKTLMAELQLAMAFLSKLNRNSPAPRESAQVKQMVRDLLFRASCAAS